MKKSFWVGLAVIVITVFVVTISIFTSMKSRSEAASFGAPGRGAAPGATAQGNASGKSGGKPSGNPQAKGSSGKNSGGKSGSTRGSGSTVISVKTHTVDRETLHDYVITNGEVEAQNSVSAYPDISGKIISTEVMLGSKVNRGDVIAYIDPSVPGEKYQKSSVRAPISGSIISTPLKNGSTVSTSTAIAIVGDISRLQVSADIPERYVAVLKNGLKADVTVEAYPGVVFKATVKYVSPVVDSTSRTKKIILNFDKADSRMNAGMFARLVLYTQDYSGELTMPNSGLIDLNEHYYVYVVKDDNTVEKREVTVGKNVDGITQITSGLNDGEKVVIQGQTSLSNGAAVRDITNASATSESQKGSSK